MSRQKTICGKLVSYFSRLHLTNSILCMIFMLAEREEGRLNNELRRLNFEQDELKDKRNTYEVRTWLDLLRVSDSLPSPAE